MGAHPTSTPTRGFPGGFQETAPLSLDDLAARWGVHRTTAFRRTAAWGVRRMEMSKRTLRFRPQDIEAAEARMAGQRK